MISYLIDTNVVSELGKPQPNPNVTRWFEKTAPDQLFASVVSFGEIRLGIESLPYGKCRSGLEDWVEQGLPDWFASNFYSSRSTLPIAGRASRCKPGEKV